MGIIFQLEERYKFSPNLFGEALTTMKDKLSQVDDLDAQIKASDRMLSHGRDIAEKLAEYEELAEFRSEGNDEYLSQFNFTEFDIECYEIALRYKEQNPSSVSSLPSVNDGTVQKLADDMREIKNVIAPTYTNEENPTLKVAFKQWQENKKYFYATPIQFDRNYERIRLFIMFTGDDVRMNELTENHVTDFKDFRKVLKFGTPIKGKSLKEIKANICTCGKCKTTGKGTLNDAFVSVGTFFGWCHEKGGKKYPINPDVKAWMNTRYDIDVSDVKDKQIFSDEHLKLLFNNIAYIKDSEFPISKTTGKTVREWRFGKFSTTAMYWVQIIALFTGIRQKAILQLEEHDIRKDKESGKWVIHFKYYDVESDDEDKRGKTKSSDVIVPIHNQLIKLDFLGYVDSIESGSIFPDEPRDKESKIFKEYQDHYQWWRRTLGVKARKGVNEKIDFHIFRGTVRTKLLLANGNPQLIDKIVGHSSKDDSTGDKSYTFSNNIENKAKLLNKLKYDAIDFDNMIRWKHCEFKKKLVKKNQP